MAGYWETPTDIAVLTADVFHSLLEKVRNEFGRLDTIILHPDVYAEYMRCMRYWKRRFELLHDEKLREAWMDGWTARSKSNYSRRRKQISWVKFCEDRARKENE